MFGWRLIKESELRLTEQMHENELRVALTLQRAAEEYARKAENLLQHERDRIDSERERADRIADSLFQSQGLPPTSTTVVTEVKAAEKVSADKLERYMAELSEIYADQEDELLQDGAEPLPEVIAEKAP
jgi:hypothetical protein